MRKLVKGIVEFRQKVLPTYREKFAKLALGQAPDTLFIACSDSRVVPNLFASTDPGDLFVIRNVGNIIPPCQGNGHSCADEAEGAAIEYALGTLKVSDIVVCGHSECGAMRALLDGRNTIQTPNLRGWLRHGESSLQRITDTTKPDLWQELSKQNVLQQLENLLTYNVVKEKVSRGEVRLHAWFFELRTADVYAFDNVSSAFGLLDEVAAKRVLAKLDS